MNGNCPKYFNCEKPKRDYCYNKDYLVRECYHNTTTNKVISIIDFQKKMKQKEGLLTAQ
ncbi:MAG: hypothetical protein ABIJ14_01615 [Nanoarchaeota archaeon]